MAKSWGTLAGIGVFNKSWVNWLWNAGLSITMDAVRRVYFSDASYLRQWNNHKFIIRPIIPRDAYNYPFGINSTMLSTDPCVARWPLILPKCSDTVEPSHVGTAPLTLKLFWGRWHAGSSYTSECGHWSNIRPEASRTDIFQIIFNLCVSHHQRFVVPRSTPPQLQMDTSLSPTFKDDGTSYAMGALQLRKRHNRKKSITGELIWDDSADVGLTLGKYVWWQIGTVKVESDYVYKGWSSGHPTGHIEKGTDEPSFYKSFWGVEESARLKNRSLHVYKYWRTNGMRHHVRVTTVSNFAKDKPVRFQI